MGRPVFWRECPLKMFSHKIVKRPCPMAEAAALESRYEMGEKKADWECCAKPEKKETCGEKHCPTEQKRPEKKNCCPAEPKPPEKDRCPQEPTCRPPKLPCHPRPQNCCCPDARQLLRWALWNTGLFRCDNSCKSGWSSRKRRW